MKIAFYSLLTILIFNGCIIGKDGSSIRKYDTESSRRIVNFVAKTKTQPKCDKKEIIFRRGIDSISKLRIECYFYECNKNFYLSTSTKINDDRKNFYYGKYSIKGDTMFLYFDENAIANYQAKIVNTNSSKLLWLGNETSHNVCLTESEKETRRKRRKQKS